MSCREIRLQLAIYRELTTAEQQRLQEHLRSCPGCAEALADYETEDRQLSGLATVEVSPALANAILSRTVAGRRPVSRPRWRFAAAALSLLLCFAIVGTTVSRAADALPGDPLYSIKRGMEGLRLALMLDPVRRAQYERELAETRQQEVREVIRLNRQALVQFEGELVAVEDGTWRIDDFQVAVGAEVWSGMPPAPGSNLLVQAKAATGRLQATRVWLMKPPKPTAEPEHGPVATHSPPHAPTLTRQPALSPQPTVRPSETEPPGHGAQPTVTPGSWGPGPQSSSTPDSWGPGPQPSAAPGAWGPGPQPSTTPNSWGPGPQPSAAPGAWGPGPQPSTTPNSWGAGPQSSATPGPSGHGPQSSSTPSEQGPGPQPSMTPCEWGTQAHSTPTSQPSVTPSTAGPDPRASATPGTSGPRQQPSSTPGPGGR